MTSITHSGVKLTLRSEKAVYIDTLNVLLVSDVHLGKSETFQAQGIPIPSHVNQETLHQLQALCIATRPDQLIILGDLFHSPMALDKDMLNQWLWFLEAIALPVVLILGNHDRPLLPLLTTLPITCYRQSLLLASLILSHDPQPTPDKYLNICGHIHPCLRLRTGLDCLRLPCFHFDRAQRRLTLPAFGEFTGGYEVQLNNNSTAYVIAEDTVIAVEGRAPHP
jgi:DNA ligase-associated metallophosphoesterase